MSRFAPPRVSSPPKPSTLRAASLARDVLDDSRSSALSIPELAVLSLSEIDFLDAVIERAPPTATTFLTVFKAYNDILQERGVDPQHEVVYYGKLLKLGTLKGKNWGEKWMAVKQQQPGYNGGAGSGKSGISSRPLSRASQLPIPRAQVLTRLTGALKNIEREEDALTLHSHQDDIDAAPATRFNNEGSEDAAQYRRIPRFVPRSTSPTFTSTTNTLGLNTGPPSTSYILRTTVPALTPRQPLTPQTIGVWDAETSENTADTTRTPSTIPPSYGAATCGNDAVQRVSYTPLRALAKAHSKAGSSLVSTPSVGHTAPSSAREAVLKARERRGSVVNEDDAWNKIKMARDEKEADRFREERLVERCWDVWKQGYEWITTTSEQIAQARDNLILRLGIHKWRNLTASRLELYQRVSSLSDNRRLKVAFQIWKVKFREKKQAEWRNDMRSRMKTVRVKREMKLKKDAWAKWRQSHRSHLADQHFNEKLVVRFLRRWRAKLATLEELEATAEMFVTSKENTQMERCWDLWRQAAEMRKAERMVSDRVALRVLTEVMDVWKRRLHQTQVADELYDKIVMKRALGSWRAAKDRIKSLENKARKHLYRQNEVLVIAVMRVWKAHERGKLLERVKTVRLLKQTWETWKRRLRHQQELEDLAMAFSMRSSSSLASTHLQRWRQVYASHRNAETFAIHYRSSQIRFKMLLIWRIQLRAKLKLVKQAKVAEKFFVMRGAWKHWVAKLEERKRERKVKQFENKVLKKYMDEWITSTHRQREQKLAEEIIQQRVALRVMTSTLNHWTTRVADLKFRELMTTQQYERNMLTAAFKKWKALCIRHVEELSLMESYQDVKREENMRRMFYRWLAAARKARHRRLLLQEREDEMKLTVIAGSWDKWRERFLDVKLQPMADAFLIQSQQNLVFRTFGIWHSKTRSLPAVRFHASHSKANAWTIWRDAMPKALQSKQAREMDQKSILTKTFEKWLQAYKTKIALKAVARARYLRLPTAAPRQGAQQARPIPATASTSAYPRRAVQRSSPPPAESDDASAAPLSQRRFRGRSGIASLLTTRPRSPDRSEGLSRSRLSASPKRPKLTSRSIVARESSPTRSVASVATRQSEPFPRSGAGPPSSSGEVKRSRLWQELRELQLKSRPPTERSHSREPP